MAIHDLTTPIVGIKGAGEMASAVAHRLFVSGIRNILLMDLPAPLAVRRRVSFSDAIYDGVATVEGVKGERVDRPRSVVDIWERGSVAVIVDPKWRAIETFVPTVVVDAILAKANLGSSTGEAELVIGLGPGFCAGIDVHAVIETNRGHDLGRIVEDGRAARNTGVPGTIAGYDEKRVLRSPAPGVFFAVRDIGDILSAGDLVGTVGTTEVRAPIDGVVRGLIRSNVEVAVGIKLGDIDPRGVPQYCSTISDKARNISGAVLQLVVRHMAGKWNP